MKVDCVGIIDAGYAPSASEEAWLGSVLEPFEPMARGMGLTARFFDFGVEQPKVGDPVSRGPIPADLQAGLTGMYSFLAQHHAGGLKAMLSPNPSVVCWASKRVADLAEEVRPLARGFLAGTGLLDQIGILAADPAGPTLLINVPYAEAVTIPPRTIRQITRATAHLCSAIRLRSRAVAGGGATATSELPPDVEAVLDPSGRVHHAGGSAEGKEARSSLTQAVRRVERARGRLRHTDPEEALAIWLALFEGRWSVVEQTESDGRRFLLARRNEPGPRDPMALTQGERDAIVCAARGHSNKYIGYLLGVTTSTVSSRLESSLRKLGLSSRREAIEMLGRGPAVA